MGRININFHVTGALAILSPPGMNPNAIPAKDLAMVLLNLPGATHITGCVTGITSKTSLMTENTVEAINDKLEDGTNIRCRYIRSTVMVNGTIEQFDRLDGFDIEPPLTSYKTPAPLWPSSPQKSQSPLVTGSGSLGPCTSSHDWATYTGLNDSYEYCKCCGVKK